MINADGAVVITDPREIPTGYVQMIALSWALYDLFLTFDDEVQFIWCRRFRWNSFLFLATRYFTLILLVMSAIVCTVSGFSHMGCAIFDWSESIGTIILFVLVQLILQMRIYIMYGRSRKILIVNLSLFLLEAVISGVLVAFYFGGKTPAIVPESTLGSCFYVSQRKLAASWAAPLAYEIWLACLALYKIYEEHEVMKVLPGTSLVALIVRDNIIYFFMIVAAMIVNVICFVFTDLNPGISVITIVHSVGSIGGTRIVLSLLRGTDQPMQLSTTGRVHMPSNFGVGFLDLQSPPEKAAEKISETSNSDEQSARIPDGTTQLDVEAGLQQRSAGHEPEIKRDTPTIEGSDLRRSELMSDSSTSSTDLEASPVASTSGSTLVSPAPSSSSQTTLA